MRRSPSAASSSPTRGCKRALPRILLASAIMGAVLWGVATALDGLFKPPTSELVRAGALTVLIGAGLLAYAIAVFATGRSTCARRAASSPAARRRLGRSDA